MEKKNKTFSGSKFLTKVPETTWGSIRSNGTYRDNWPLRSKILCHWNWGSCARNSIKDICHVCFMSYICLRKMLGIYPSVHKSPEEHSQRNTAWEKKSMTKIDIVSSKKALALCGMGLTKLTKRGPGHAISYLKIFESLSPVVLPQWPSHDRESHGARRQVGFKFHWGFLLAEHQPSETGKHWLRHTNQQSLLKVAWWGCEKNLLICRRSKQSWCVLLSRPKNTFQ